MYKNKAAPCGAVGQYLLLRHPAMGPQVQQSLTITLKIDHSE